MTTAVEGPDRCMICGSRAIADLGVCEVCAELAPWLTNFRQR